MWRESFQGRKAAQLGEEEVTASTRVARVALQEQKPFVSDRYVHLRYGAAPAAPQGAVQLDVERMMGGCTALAAMGLTGGFLMGILMGGFMHTMQPLSVDTSQSSWTQIQQSYRGFGAACTRMGRSFAKVGAVYAGVECWFERKRACKDVPNAMYAGCVTGGVLAFQGGPQAMVLGCAGFAAFSAVIENVMGS